MLGQCTYTLVLTLLFSDRYYAMSWFDRYNSEKSASRLVITCLIICLLMLHATVIIRISYQLQYPTIAAIMWSIENPIAIKKKRLSDQIYTS